MKSSRAAFYATFKFITEMTNKIFSLGCDRLNYCSSIWPIPFYLIGKLAKYVIGFPLGIVAGLFAGGIVGIVNLFKNKKVNDIEKEVSPTSHTATFNPVSHELKKEGMRNLFLSDVDITSNRPIFNTEFNEFKKEGIHNLLLSSGKDGVPVQDTNIKKKAKIYQSALNEKKVKLRNKIDLLGVLIEDKITLLNQRCKIHDEILTHCDQLQSQLNDEGLIAHSAQKFSHNQPYTEKKMSCPCGFVKSYICPHCKMPAISHETIKTTPIYVPDTAKRNLAKRNCVSIAKELASEKEKTLLTQAEYTKREDLIEIKEKLCQFISLVSNVQNENKLLELLTNYSIILSEVEKHMSEEKSFRKNDYLPKSDYAQSIIAAMMIRQTSRGNVLFQKIPEEVQELIALATTLPGFSQEEARNIFRLNSK